MRGCARRNFWPVVRLGERAKGFVNSLGIYDREKGIKILAFDVTQRYEVVQRFVITDAELRELGGEVDRVPGEEVPMDTVEHAIDL